MTDSTLATGALSHFVHCARKAYTLPSVAMQVLELTDQPTIDTMALKQCIQNDPALTAKILRVANSSLLGLSGEVSDLNQALALLGRKRLKLLVLGFSLPKELFSGIEAEVLTHYWNHALIKAVAAREISQRFWNKASDEAFIAGLLQDIGMLVLIQELGDSYTCFLKQVLGNGQDLATLEIDTLGFQHTLLSARILEDWKLPSSLTCSVGTSFDVKKITVLPADHRSLVQALHLAELLAQALIHRRPAALNELLEVGEIYCDLTFTQLQEILGDLTERTSELADVLTLQPPQIDDYAEVLISAHSRLAEAAEEISSQLPDASAGADSILQHAMALKTELRRAVNASNDSVTRPNVVRQHPTSSGRSADDRPNLPPSDHDRSLAGRSSINTGTRTLASSASAEMTNGGSGADPQFATASSTACSFPDLGWIGRLTAAVSACRQARCSLSLVFVEMDRYDEILFHSSSENVERQHRRLEFVLSSVCDGTGFWLLVGDARYAVILPRCDRPQAVEIGKQLIQHVRRNSQEDHANRLPIITISAGAATLTVPPKNFPPQELIDAAERCLYAAQTLGGDSLKSIDLV